MAWNVILSDGMGCWSLVLVLTGRKTILDVEMSASSMATWERMDEAWLRAVRIRTRARPSQRLRCVLKTSAWRASEGGQPCYC